MQKLASVNSKSILSTKKLSAAQLELVLGSGLGITHFNILTVQSLDHKLPPHELEHLIITSSNAIPAIEAHIQHVKNVYVVGEKTSDLLTRIGCKVVFTALDSKALAKEIISRHSEKKFTYLCGIHRRNDLPDALKASQINFKEIKVYDTKMVMRSYDRIFDAVLCYSPRGVYAFAKANPKQLHHAICIGETTATAAREFATKVTVATKTTVENTIVTAIKALRND